MKHRIPPWAMKILLSVVVVSALAAGSVQPAATGQNRSWDNYRILLDRNIFRRDRRAAPAYTGAATQPHQKDTYDSDRSIVLTGVAKRHGKFVAFLEDTQTNMITKAHVGEAVGEGKVLEITLDDIQYWRDGAAIRIGIGCSLTGTTTTMPGVPSALVTPESPTDSRDEPTTKPAGFTTTTAPAPFGTSPRSTTGSDTSGILERMRRRRQQEMRR